MSVTVTPVMPVPDLVSWPSITGCEPASMTELPADADSTACPAATEDDGDALGGTLGEEDACADGPAPAA